MTSNTITALKALYVACGGSVATVANLDKIPDLINALADAITAGSMNELPAVTTTDNGKVLKVESGKWAVGTDATE